MDAKTTPTASEKSEPFEGLVRHEGGSTPTSDPHVCAFLRIGASKARCLELTSIYNRNIEGCCGTSDNRSFPPCNSQWRKCRECIADGRGSKSGSVVDVKRGLCEEHEHKAGRAAAAPAVPVVHVAPTRVGVKRFEPTVPFKPTNKPATVSRPVRSYEPPGARSQSVPPKPAERPVRDVVVQVSTKPSISATVSVPQLPDDTLDACVRRYRGLTELKKKAFGCLAQGLPVPGWKETHKSRKSELLTQVGIPNGRNRLMYAQQVLARHEASPLTSEEVPDHDADTSTVEVYDVFDQEVLNSFNLEKALKRYRRLTDRKKEVAGYLVRGQLPPDLSVKSVASLRSSIFNEMGIPRVRISLRLDLLRQVVERHDMLEAMSPTHRAVEEPPNAVMTTDEREIRLLTHFRALPQIEQDQVEQMVKALVVIEKQKRPGG